MHKLRKSQKADLSKTAVEVVDMQTSEIQLHSGLAEYISYGLALFYTKNNLPLSYTFQNLKYLYLIDENVL